MLCRIGEIEVWRILEIHAPFLTPEELFPTAGPDVRRIVEASVVDDLTVALKTDTPAATLPLDLTRLFVIPSEVAIDTPVGDFNSGAKAIGTGPYKLSSWGAKGDSSIWYDDWSEPVRTCLWLLVPGTVGFTVSKVLQADLAARDLTV